MHWNCVWISKVLFASMNVLMSLMVCVLFTCYFSVQTTSANVVNYLITTLESFHIFALLLSECFSSILRRLTLSIRKFCLTRSLTKLYTFLSLLVKSFEFKDFAKPFNAFKGV